MLESVIESKMWWEMVGYVEEEENKEVKEGVEKFVIISKKEKNIKKLNKEGNRR